jgi:hypothetical protein
VFPVRYELNIDMGCLSGRSLVFKKLKTFSETRSIISISHEGRYTQPMKLVMSSGLNFCLIFKTFQILFLLFKLGREDINYNKTIKAPF